MRKVDYVVERAIYGDYFKDKVIALIVGQYGVTKEQAANAYDNCMVSDYAVILPVSDNYPNGVMIATDVFRNKVAIG